LTSTQVRLSVFSTCCARTSTWTVRRRARNSLAASTSTYRGTTPGAAYVLLR